MKKFSLDGTKDYKPVHLGTHDAVARAVQNGQVPAGALSEAIYRALVERKTIDESKLIVSSTCRRPIPNYPMTMQGYLASRAEGQDPQGIPGGQGPGGA